MTQDQLHRYLFEEYEVRGELVQLDQTYRHIVDAQSYPLQIQRLLGELLVATSMLTATLKFEGSITVQLQGDGPVKMAVINGDHNQQLRGVARFEGELPASNALKDLVGNGQLVITITPDQGERYQGIIALAADTLSGCLEAYFAQSEQLPTRLWIRTGMVEGQPKAAGIMVQALPAQSEDHEADFDHLVQLTETIKDEELFTLPAEEILYRLYNQDRVRLFDPQSVEFRCTCSRERCQNALLQVGREESLAIVQEQGQIDMHCDYCGNHYIFDGIDVETLFNVVPGNDANKLH
ncbi:Hsp33 family molecular chaperone HslO [Aeromonas diversa]|uniref:Hsp33 family molecular chaperone HslO n=1 Tax=Aeromonas diversa TaxID=502790 RepID=UPI003462DB82